MSGEQAEKPKNDAEFYGLVTMLVLVGVVLIAAWINRYFNSFYSRYFEEIYLWAYVALVGFSVLVYFYAKRKTKGLFDRYQRLKPLRAEVGSILVGCSTKEKVDLYISNDARTGHVQILGATGRGKTESVILPWLLRDLWEGKSAILIDGKGDPKLGSRIKSAIPLIRKPPQYALFDLSHPDASFTTNPLASGSAQQITDRLFTTFEFKDPFYKSVQYREAGVLVSLIQASGDGIVTFRKLYDLLTDVKKFTQAIGEAKDKGLQEKCQRLLRLPDREREANLLGLISQIEPFAVGEIAPLVNGPVDGKDYLAISDVVLGRVPPTVFVFLISTLKFQELGKQLGKLLLQELAWAVGERSATTGEESPFLPVFLDEFSAFVYPGFFNLLNKARSSQVALHLSHQSIGDLKIVDPELATIINTNTNVKCLLGLNDPETADFFARHLGTESTEKLTERGESTGWLSGTKKTGDVSIRAVESYRIHPNRLKNYTRGMGVLSVPTDRGIITEEVQFKNIELSQL